jgi:oligogalacturonide lyase
MIGTVYTSEKSTFTDMVSGQKITQLTNRGINFHLYFTDNSFDINENEIYFVSNRGQEEKEIFNLFRMDLESGIMTQLTDDPEGIEVGRITKTPDSEYIAYITGQKLRLLNTKTGKNEVLYEEDRMLLQNIFFQLRQKDHRICQK